MISRKIIGSAPLLLLVGTAVSGCISLDSDLADAADKCEEFGTGNQNVDVDASVKLFMEASANFRGLSTDMKGSVRTACANIAIDLGASDTWSEHGNSDASISNADGTGACDVASSRIAVIMDAEASANANFALVVSRGKCHPDFAAQAACDAQCKAEATCDSGTVETRCEPAELSVQCSGECVANAYCEGTMDLPANCMGLCESTCQGECKGACIAADGTRTDNNPNCHGKCSSSCNGTCRGLCKVEAVTGVQCGTSVSCRGGCQGTYTAPECVSMFTPPTCTVDAACSASCSAQVAANAVCDPPVVTLIANATVSAEVQILVETVNRNLPTLIAQADVQGEIVVEAAGRLVVAGHGVANNAGDLDGKSISCAIAATQASIQAAASAELSVAASLQVTESCRSRAN